MGERDDEIERLRAEVQDQAARRARAESAMLRLLDSAEDVRRMLAEEHALLAETDRDDDDRARVFPRTSESRSFEPAVMPRTMRHHVGARRLALQAMETAREALERARAEALSRFGIVP